MTGFSQNLSQLPVMFTIDLWEQATGESQRGEREQAKGKANQGEENMEVVGSY